jgi:plasmid maintenance system antidote protein VapI
MICGMWMLNRQYTEELNLSFEMCEEFWINLALALDLNAEELELASCKRLMDA